MAGCCYHTRYHTMWLIASHTLTSGLYSLVDNVTGGVHIHWWTTSQVESIFIGGHRHRWSPYSLVDNVTGGVHIHWWTTSQVESIFIGGHRHRWSPYSLVDNIRINTLLLLILLTPSTTITALPIWVVALTFGAHYQTIRCNYLRNYWAKRDRLFLVMNVIVCSPHSCNMHTKS